MEEFRSVLQNLKRFLKTHWLGVGLWSVLTIVATTVVGQVVWEHLDQARSGPEEYKVFVVGGKAIVDGRKDFVYHMKQAIERTWQKSAGLIVRGKPVILEYREDNWEPERADDISKQLAERDDILLVIGHFASSTSKRALKNYLGAEPPIPVILTTETNPHLLPETQDSDPLPVFRLWPTDKEQAEAVVDFAISKGKRVFWIIEDQAPQMAVYSHYLAEEIVKRLQGAGQTVRLWSRNQSIPPAETVRSLEIDAVIFPGMASSALILVSQLRKIWKDKNAPDIFLTDASLDYLILTERRHLNTLNNVYVSHPALVACEDIGSMKGPFSETGKLAADAGMIARELIERASHNLKTSFLNRLGVQDVRELRRAVIDEMAKPHIYQGIEGREYKFREGGLDEGAGFKLWQIQDGKFAPEEGCETQSIVETWVNMLVGSLESNQAVIVEKFALLRTAAELTGKVLTERFVSDEELAAFSRRVNLHEGYLKQTTREYFRALHASAVELTKVNKDLARKDLTEDDTSNLVQEKQRLRSWFDKKSDKLTLLLREHLQSLSGRKPAG